MAKLFLSVLSFLLIMGSSFALRGDSRQQGECQITSINSQESSYTLRAEGGETDFWDYNHKQFRCAGVSIRRHRIQQKGLLLPVYHNAPILVYVERGSGIYGLMVSGCPETFESSQQLGDEERSQRFRDQHQKIGECRQGDIIAIQAGSPHWVYNDADDELVLVVLHDNGNNANQLDQNPRSFFLAGNPEREEEREQHERRGDRQRQLGNVFRGFETRTLAEAFGVDEETARKLKGEEDYRGHIIRVERSLRVIKPPSHGRSEQEEEERYYRGSGNGMEETICSAKNRENLDRSSRADIYNPQAGRFSTVNSFTLPILRFLQLSASRGVLYRNAIMSPHWYVNAHNIIYVTRGELRMQIVNYRGQAVFDGQVRKGQVVVVPQNFAVVKQASEQGGEWVGFNTNDNAMINTLSGRTSALRGLPADVVASAYQISREDAQKLKFSREETLLFSGSSDKSGRPRVASA